MDIKKDVLTLKGTGYVDSIKVHWIIDDRNVVSSTDTPGHFFQGTGTMFAATYQSSLETVDSEASQIDPDKCIAVRAGLHAGNLTIPIKRRITQDGFDGVEMDGDIRLWMKNTDSTTDDTLVYRLFVEVIGRYVKGVPL